ncbi:M16 family metallopeptidase [Janthinobacterium fluminis]|uniref:Pitrilysin family protein n=1 Tax=Janthinobacterium fluminis TaxID=2987524 RepID=A0ABT5K6L3_9BURK|nr:pitrilysin family protein [Janthinobacterium fluminis]MDC8760048.1 pitrilysin family protein [Janthinobacterium fluminis]
MKPITAILLSAGILSPSFVFAAAPQAPAATQKAGAPASAVKVTSVEGITEYRLSNGMRVLLFPDASKPTLTTNIIYLVGSRHENYGETGMAHLLEHLLFKPSANFGVKKGTKTPVEILNSTGARFNGTTWYDRTNYYATFPANDDNLRQLLALEADRMVNAAIDQNDLWNPQTKKGEMTVVRNEFEMGESDPIGVTTERMQAIAYDWHNYGKSTIGARSDIEQVNIPRLRAFYKKYYQPDNAVLMVAGRFDEAKVLKQVNELFGRIPKPARVIEPTYTTEPTQDGERAVTVRRSGGTQFVGAGYHVAPSGHPDAVALSLLGRILVDAPSGRLHKALVETKLAAGIDYNAVSNLEPGYNIFGAVVPKDGQLDVAQDTMLKVLEGLKDAPVTEAEVARARQQINKGIELATADTARLTVALTEALAAGDWRLFFLQRDQLAKVDAATVQAAALKYLKASNRTLGRFIPTDAPDRAEVPSVADLAVQLKDYTGRAVVAQGEAFDPSPANIEARTQRFALPGGLKGALLAKKTKGGTVSATVQLRLGTEASLQGKATAGSFAAGLLNRGTATLSRQEIKDRFDKLNAQVSINGNAEGVTASVTSTRENLPAALDLLADVLKKPAFVETEFLEFQRARVSNAEQDMPEPQPLALNAFRRLLDGTAVGNVRHVGTLAEQLADLKAVTVADVKAFHAAFYGAGNATFSAVGDFDPAALKAQVATLFDGWKAPQSYVRIPDALKPAAGQKLALETPDKANSVLVTLLPLNLKDDATGYPALLMANHMLGGGALRSRLADRIRQKEGLSYGVGSELTVPAREPAALWMAYAISAPQNTAKVEAALREELDKALAEGFTDAELAEAKKGWLQSREVSRTQDAGLAARLSGYLALERTMAFDKELEAKVAGLTLAQVNEGLRQYLKPANLSVVKAGDFAKAGKDAVVK